MRYSILAITLLTSSLTALATQPAEANNSTVENALKSRPDLSYFYQGLQNTGVLGELKEDQSYTIFAPTNEAFLKYPAEQYPCFYSESCRGEVAQILRNHIVTGEKHLSDIYPQEGGVMSLFSIDRHHLTGSEPYKGTFAVNGHAVLSENQLAGGVLYRIDGLIATRGEMVQFENDQIVKVYNASTGLPPRVPQGTIMTRTVTTTIPEN